MRTLKPWEAYLLVLHLRWSLWWDKLPARLWHAVFSKMKYWFFEDWTEREELHLGVVTVIVISAVICSLLLADSALCASGGECHVMNGDLATLIFGSR